MTKSDEELSVFTLYFEYGDELLKKTYWRFPLNIKIASYLDVKVDFIRFKDKESNELIQETKQSGEHELKTKFKQEK